MPASSIFLIIYAIGSVLLIRWLDKKQYPRSRCGRFYFTRVGGRLQINRRRFL